MTSIVPVGFCFRIDACRLRHAYSIHNIIRPKSPPRDNDGHSYTFYNLPVDFPAVGYTKRADLRVAGPMTVEEQQLCNSIVALRNGDALPSLTTGMLRIIIRPVNRL